jgi:hypothetical protein
MATIAMAVIAAIALIPAFGEYLLQRGSESTISESTRPAPASADSAGAKITYYGLEALGNGYTSIVANADGREYEVIEKENGICYAIVEQRDFDGNGIDDALVEVNACGGNCCLNTYLFATYAGNGYFQTSDTFGYTLEKPQLQEWQGMWSVLVSTESFDVNTDRATETRQQFILDSGRAVEIYGAERRELISLHDLRAEDFETGEQGAVLEMVYDLDGDGLEDRIKGSLWERWGRVLWQVEFGNGTAFQSNSACRRLGILPTMTHSVHDLVCDFDTIYRWTGDGYTASSN